MATRKSGGLLDNVKTIIYAGLIAVAIRSFVVEPFNIPSGSMIPTLLVGDYLFVEKWAYGYSRYSLPFGPDIFAGRIFGSLPRRGDVVVFRFPPDPSIDYIKRVIGLPGDTVQVRDGQLYINGNEVPRGPLGTYTETLQGVGEQAALYREDLPGGKKHLILKETDQGPMNNTAIYTVPPGTFFAMGDNRDDSEDSRFPPPEGPGYVPMENLVGRAAIIFFSIDARYPWYEFWEWPVEIRWNRLFKVIH